jgi:hypothetical protein
MLNSLVFYIPKITNSPKYQKIKALVSRSYTCSSMEYNRWTRAVRFAKSNMDEIYFQDVSRTTVILLLILVNFQISFSFIFLRLQLCPLH